jgi:hypothetical protein
MNCAHCRKKFAADEPKCPYCGAERAEAGSGVFQSSTVLISAEGSETFYRSVDEVPDSLKTKLLKSTNSSNSATILIADRRGRKEIAKAMRSLPGTAQRRMLHSILGGGESASSGPAWITPNRRKAILGVLLALALALVAFAFTRR